MLNIDPTKKPSPLSRLLSHFAKPVSSDHIEGTVAAAIAEARLPQGQQNVRTFEELVKLPADVLLAELVLWVEDETANRDINDLLANTTLPLPPEPRTLTDLALAADIRGLHSYAKGDLLILVTSLLALVAALQEAGERLN